MNNMNSSSDFGTKPKIVRPDKSTRGNVSPVWDRRYNVWRYKWRTSRAIGNGKALKREGTKTKQADAWASVKKANEVLAGLHHDRARGWTVERWCRYVLDESHEFGEHLANSTRYTYSLILAKHVYPSIGHVCLSDLVKETHIDALRSDLRFRMPKSWYKPLVVLRRCLDEAFPSLIPYNPVGKLRMKRQGSDSKRDFIALEDVAEILSVVKGTWLAGPFYAATRYGMRRGEICGLRKSDLDRKKGILNITNQRYPSKGGTMDTAPKWGSVGQVPLQPEIAAYADAQQGPLPYVFLGARGKPLDPRTLSNCVRKLFDELDITCDDGSKASLHNLRKTWVTLASSLGVSQKTRMSVVRHKSDEAHGKYDCPMLEEQKEALRRIDAAINEAEQAE